MSKWNVLDKKLNLWQVESMLGLIPELITVHDPRSVAEQIADNYAHGGGYSPFGKGRWKFDPVAKSLKYPGDSAYKGVAELRVRDELFIVFQHAVCAVVQKDGSFDVVRMD